MLLPLSKNLCFMPVSLNGIVLNHTLTDKIESFIFPFFSLNNVYGVVVSPNGFTKNLTPPKSIICGGENGFQAQSFRF
jgi:hypothetical protein